MSQPQPATRWGSIGKPGTIAALGLAVLGSKILLPPFAHNLPTTLLSTLSDFSLTVLLVVAAWQAARRSSQFAQVL